MNPAILAEIRSTWDRIRDHGRILAATLRFHELSRASDEGLMLVAVDDGGLRHLLVPVRHDSIILADRQSKGVHILRHELVEGSKTRIFLDVVCWRSELHELFDAVISEMVETVSGQKQQPSPACREVLDRWRDLLERMRPERLGKQALIGLFGELQLLRRLVEMSPESLSAWRGPDGARHDFAGKKVALEVKTSTARQGWSCEIHGHDQLEPPPHGNLFLAVLKIEQSEEGRSIPGLVEDILVLGVDAPAFFKKLAGAGYDVRDAPEYEDPRFHLLQERMYRVEEEFPRIVSSSFLKGALPSGVTHIRYGIELAGEPPFPLSAEEAGSVINDLATGAG